MKKTISVILTAVILMISVLPLNAFADEAPILTLELIEKLKTSDEISVTFKSGQARNWLPCLPLSWSCGACRLRSTITLPTCSRS